MAIMDTPNLISGRIGNLIYYVRDGKQCVRSMPVHDKKKHASAPSMEPVRRHNAEFSASSRAGAVFRTALGSWRKALADGQFNGKVTSLMFQIVSTAEGEKGRRPLAVRANAHRFHRLPLDAGKTFSKAADALVKRSPSDEEATLALQPSTLLGAAFPQGATHFRWVTLAFAVPDFEFVAKARQYEPTAEAPAPAEVTGEWISVSDAAALSLSFPLTADCAHFLALGLQFGQANGAGVSVLEEASYMEILTLSPSHAPRKQAPAAKSAPVRKEQVAQTPVAKAEPAALQSPTPTVEAPVAEVPFVEAPETPVVQLKRVEEVPVELVLPGAEDDMDLGFEPELLEEQIPTFEKPSPVMETPLAAVEEAPVQEPVMETPVVESPVMETSVEEAPVALESPVTPVVETATLPVESPLAETVAPAEEAKEVKPRKERKPRTPKAEAEPQEDAKAEKAKQEKAKADTGQLSLFF